MSDKPSPPLVKNDRVVGTHVYVGTNVWFEHWLADPKLESFRYECPEGSFTARQRKGGYWNAYRKVKGRLRQEYLGKASDLTQTKLIETARTLAMDNTEYWPMKYPRPDQAPQPSQESTGLYNHPVACITEAQEKEEARRLQAEAEAQIEALQARIEVLTKDQAQHQVTKLKLNQAESRAERLQGLVTEYQTKLEAIAQPKLPTTSPDPGDILQQLREKLGRKSKATIQDVELIVELLATDD